MEDGDKGVEVLPVRVEELGREFGRRELEEGASLAVLLLKKVLDERGCGVCCRVIDLCGVLSLILRVLADRPGKVEAAPSSNKAILPRKQVISHPVLASSSPIELTLSMLISSNSTASVSTVSSLSGGVPAPLPPFSWPHSSAVSSTSNASISATAVADNVVKSFSIASSLRSKLST